MAYTNETVHYGFPLPLAADLTVPMDYNESLEAADTALFEAQTNAAGAVGTAGNALTVANEAKTEAQSATAIANSATATANAAATAANEAVSAVAEAKDDALDMICAVVEETATAQYKHEPTKDGLNYYFRYNDILYKTTAVINVGETIVPNTNCAATNVATELEALEGDSSLTTRVETLEGEVDEIEAGKVYYRETLSSADTYLNVLNRLYSAKSSFEDIVDRCKLVLKRPAQTDVLMCAEHDSGKFQFTRCIGTSTLLIVSNYVASATSSAGAMTINISASPTTITWNSSTNTNLEAGTIVEIIV